MNKTILKIMKLGRKLLSRTIPDSDELRYLTYLPKFNTFCKNHPEEAPLFENKLQMYDYINETVIKHQPVAYCEFGVYKGTTIKYWAKINSHIHSVFYGFDTFTGLPEPWKKIMFSLDKSTFDTGGEIPRVSDDRVSFFKGLFQTTLPSFVEHYDNEHQLIINNDSDLYSSTLYTLTTAHNIIVPGTIIIFDEFLSMLHEFRALEDYCSSYLREYKILAAANAYSQVAIRIM